MSYYNQRPPLNPWEWFAIAIAIGFIIWIFFWPGVPLP